MSGIKGKDTKPEILIRKALFAKGFRYRLHDKKLPGKPDLVFPKFRSVIQIHGCFWHGHDCHLFKWPASNESFWQQKILRNKEVDQRSEKELIEQGWRVLIIWECSLKGKEKLDFPLLINMVTEWLECGATQASIVRGRGKTK